MIFVGEEIFVKPLLIRLSKHCGYISVVGVHFFGFSVKKYLKLHFWQGLSSNILVEHILLIKKPFKYIFEF
jgi:hypothetical protein